MNARGERSAQQGGFSWIGFRSVGDLGVADGCMVIALEFPHAAAFALDGIRRSRRFR